MNTKIKILNVISSVNFFIALESIIIIFLLLNKNRIDTQTEILS